MKKLLIAAVCFTAIFSMSSCTDDSSENQNTNSLAPKATVEKTNVSADGGDGTIPPPKK